MNSDEEEGNSTTLDSEDEEKETLNELKKKFDETLKELKEKWSKHSEVKEIIDLFSNNLIFILILGLLGDS